MSEKIFKGKKYYVLQTAVQVLSLMEDSTLLKTSVLGSIAKGTNIPKTLINDYVGGGKGAQIKQFHWYGEHKYPAGLVEGTVGSEAFPIDLVHTVMEKDIEVPEGKELRMGIPKVYSYSTEYYAAEDAIKKGWSFAKAVDETGYYKLTGAPKDYWIGRATIRGDTFVSYTIGNIRQITETYPGPHGWVTEYIYEIYDTEDFIFFMGDDNKFKDSDDLKYTCEYAIGSGTVWEQHVWTYYTSEEKYPELDPSGSQQGQNQYLPVIPIRIDNRSILTGPHVDEDYVKSAKRLADKIGLDLMDVVDAINANPDIAKIDHAYLVVAPKPMNMAEYVSEYFYRYFRDLYAKWFNDSYDEWDKNNNSAHTISFSDQSYYNCDFAFSYIKENYIVGKIDNGQKYKHELLEQALPPFPETDNPFQDVADGFQQIANAWATGHMKIQYQIDENLIHELYVYKMSFMQCMRIYGSPEIEEGTPWTTSYLIDESEEKNTFLIPINVDIVNQMSMIEADKLIQDSIQVVIHVWETQKVVIKWYQHEFWGFFAKVISLVISVWTGNPYLFLATQALFAVLEPLIMKIFDVIVDVIGEDAAVVIAAIAAVASVIYGIDTSFALPAVTALTFISTNLMSAVGRDLMEDMIEFRNRAQDIMGLQEEQSEELKEAQKELTPTGALDPMGIYAKVDMGLHENPKEWIDRKTMQNPGVLALDAVDNFVDRMLRLPIEEFN